MINISNIFASYAEWREDRDQLIRATRRIHRQNSKSPELLGECRLIDEEWSSLFTLYTDHLLYNTKNEEMLQKIEIINIKSKQLKKKIAVMLLTS